MVAPEDGAGAGSVPCGLAESGVVVALPELAIAFSPRQILGGFALLAAIVVWLLRRRRK